MAAPGHRKLATDAWESLLRTQGYARAPGVLSFFGFIPILGWLVAAVGGIWALVTAIVSFLLGGLVVSVAAELEGEEPAGGHAAQPSGLSSTAVRLSS